MKGGTLLERITAWYGLGLLALAMFFAFSTAFDPRFGFDSPLWIGGLLPLVWLIAAIRQLVAWYEGRTAPRILDPARARLGRRALPTLAWIAAPMFTGVLLYAILRRGGVVAEGLDVSEGLIKSGAASLAVLYGTFFVTSLLFVIMPMASDRRDRLAAEAAGQEWVQASAPDEKALRAAKELPSGMRKTASALQVLGLAGLVTSVIFFVVPWPIPTVLFYVATLPTWVWFAYIHLVVRPRLREIGVTKPRGMIRSHDTLTVSEEPSSGSPFRRPTRVTAGDVLGDAKGVLRVPDVYRLSVPSGLSAPSIAMASAV